MWGPHVSDTIFFGNSFNSARAPPKVISFPADHAVKICFKSGSIVNGHKGFRAEVTEKVKTLWINFPNYPEINDENYMEPPPNGYGQDINAGLGVLPSAVL